MINEIKTCFFPRLHVQGMLNEYLLENVMLVKIIFTEQLLQLQ